MTYKLDEDGALIEDLTKIPDIPDYMCEHSFIAQDGKIYTGGERLDVPVEWEIEAFSGSEWEFIH